MHASHCRLEALKVTTNISDCYITTDSLAVGLIHNNEFASMKNRSEHIWKI
jgi:hypothetical protein